MKFETMNWEDEADQIKSAFGIEEELEFRYDAITEVHKLYLKDKAIYEIPINTEEHVYAIRVHYNSEYKCLGILRFYDNLREQEDVYFRVDVHIDWNGQVPFPPEYRIHEVAPEFVRGLFCLGFLTPEVEHFLNVSIPVSDKAQWASDLLGVPFVEQGFADNESEIEKSLRERRYRQESFRDYWEID